MKFSWEWCYSYELYSQRHCPQGQYHQRQRPISILRRATTFIRPIKTNASCTWVYLVVFLFIVWKVPNSQLPSRNSSPNTNKTPPPIPRLPHYLLYIVWHVIRQQLHEPDVRADVCEEPGCETWLDRGEMLIQILGILCRLQVNPTIALETNMSNHYPCLM